MKNKVATSDDRNNKRQAEMAVLCQQIQVLVERLAVLTTEEDAEVTEWRPGVRVRVTRVDEYYGRIGTIIRMRSAKDRYWYVMLDATRTAKSKEIWKKEKYLEPIGDAK